MLAAAVRDYEAAYDTASILDAAAPPARLVELAARAEVLAASDMPRAIASARRIASARDAEIVPLLREIQLEPPGWVPLRLPIAAWDAMSHLQWSYRLLRSVDHAFVRRAEEAATWLVSRADGGASVLAVTHGGIRRIIDWCLRRRGWRPLPGKRGYEHWGCWSYRDGAAGQTRAGDPRP